MNLALHSLRHHARFYIALVVAGLVYAVGDSLLPGVFRPVVTGDYLFAIYLAGSALAITWSSPDSIRKRAAQQAEGMAVAFAVNAAVGAAG
jgi:uncharacterized membrane protein